MQINIVFLAKNYCVSNLPIPVAARSQSWVCESSFAGVAVPNPAGGMDVCLLLAVCVFR
jgi:hypothetical protein